MQDKDSKKPTARKGVVDKRLRGVWKSDKRATLKEWRFRKGLSPAKRKILSDIFGKLVLEYTPSLMKGKMDDYEFTHRYEIVARNSFSLVIQYQGQIEGEWCIYHIHFEKDKYWIPIGGNREWFKRLKTRPPFEGGKI